MSGFLTQIETFVAQNVPAAALDQALLAAFAALLAGVCLSVLGAKLARFVLTCACIVAGGYIGSALIAADTQVPRGVCVAGSSIVIGAIGYLAFRLWVGLLTGALVSCMALGVISYQRVLPQMAAFNAGGVAVGADVLLTDEFKLPSSGEGLEAARAGATAALSKLWEFVKSRDVDLAAHARSLALVAGLLGLLVGAVAARMSLIVCTSFLGTMLVGSGLTGLLSELSPGFYRAVADHPGVGASALGVCFAISMILQARLTREAAPNPAKPPRAG